MARGLSDTWPSVNETWCQLPLFREPSPKVLHFRFCENFCSLCPRESAPPLSLSLFFFKSHLRNNTALSFSLLLPPGQGHWVLCISLHVPFRQQKNPWKNAMAALHRARLHTYELSYTQTWTVFLKPVIPGRSWLDKYCWKISVFSSKSSSLTFFSWRKEHNRRKRFVCFSDIPLPEDH